MAEYIIFPYQYMESSVKFNLALFALLIPSLCAASGNRHETGESLLTQFGPDFSDYALYQPHTMDEHKNYTQIWRSKKRGFSDHYAINIVPARGKSLNDFKDRQFASIERICLSHTKTPIVNKQVNGYQMISWRHQCEQEKLTITSIEVAILGNDRFYHLRKLWKFPVPDEKVTEWHTLLNQTSVCDSRNQQHPCPTSNQ